MMSYATILSTGLSPGLKVPSPLVDVQNVIMTQKSWKKVLRKILYLSRSVTYDICYARNFLLRYSTNDDKSIWLSMKVTLRYLKRSSFETSYCYNNNPKE